MKTVFTLLLICIPTIGHAQWIDEGSAAKIREAWPNEVPFGNLKFYSLTPLYQHLTTTYSRPVWRSESIYAEESHPFLVSGGMEKYTGWHSIKGFDLPSNTKIQVWKQYENVRAYALVDRWRWSFPIGTKFVDVLWTDRGIFEIREQHKHEHGWSPSIAYEDYSAAPVNYKRPTSCSACHSNAGNIVSVPNKIYLRERWGSDDRFSWRPWKEDGTIDTRWPVTLK